MKSRKINALPPLLSAVGNQKETHILDLWY